MFDYKVRLPDTYWHSAKVRLLVKYYCDGIIIDSDDRMMLETASYLPDNVYDDIDFTYADDRRIYGWISWMTGINLNITQSRFKRRLLKEKTPYILCDLQKDAAYFKTIKEVGLLLNKPIYATIYEKYNTVSEFSKQFMELTRL